LSPGTSVRQFLNLTTLHPDRFAVQEESGKRPLVLISGFIHDLSTFMDEHPGGRHFLVKMIGKDATTAFFGGVYEHSNAAHNVSLPFFSFPPTSNGLFQLLSMKRVGILAGGAPHGLDDKVIPPAQRLRIARYNEISNSPYSSSAMSDVENGML
jgi:stearoyl-CoA desaturase (delta-9 desaturase)